MIPSILFGGENEFLIANLAPGLRRPALRYRLAVDSGDTAAIGALVGVALGSRSPRAVRARLREREAVAPAR